MKKLYKSFLAVILAILLVMAVSCNKNKTVGTAQRYTCTLSLNYNGMDIVADMDHSATGVCTLKVKEPSTLKGIKINWEAGELTVTCFGINIGIDAEDVPATAFVPHIMDVLDRISANEQIELSPDETGEMCIYEGTCDAGSFTAEIDPETGAVRSVKIPSYGLDIYFSDFTTY